jgi:glucan phosphoethanolaminetransferase (alkaline phosphatase superfamily)
VFVATMMNQDNFVDNAIELIEDDQANHTIMVLDQGGDDSDNENKSNIVENTAIYEESYDVPKIMWDVEKISDWSHRVTNYTD